MKRQTIRLTAHQIRRALDECAKRQTRRRGYVTLPTTRIELHGVLDLIDNPYETRGQLAKFDALRSSGSQGRQRVFVHMTNVTHIEPCALLHLAAQVDRLGQRGIKVRGNYPRDARVRRVLRDADFENFIGGRIRLGEHPKAPMLQLRKGRASQKLNPDDWIALHQFLKADPNLSAEDADAFYSAFSECVENVRQHAFSTGATGNWYAVAYRPEIGRPRAVVLDLGVGVPRTIRRKGLDHIFSFAQTVYVELFNAINLAVPETEKVTPEFLHSVLSDDWRATSLATLGLRTQTDEKRRGNGLSGLYREVIGRRQGALHVLTGRACVTWTAKEEPVRNSLPFLKGTIVCLELGA